MLQTEELPAPQSLIGQPKASLVCSKLVLPQVNGCPLWISPCRFIWDHFDPFCGSTQVPRYMRNCHTFRWKTSISARHALPIWTPPWPQRLRLTGWCCMDGATPEFQLRYFWLNSVEDLSKCRNLTTGYPPVNLKIEKSLYISHDIVQGNPSKPSISCGSSRGDLGMVKTKQMPTKNKNNQVHTWLRAFTMSLCIWDASWK